MRTTMQIRPFQRSDAPRVIALWQACGLTRPWNDPARDIERKLREQPELFLVGTEPAGDAERIVANEHAADTDRIVATVMAGYDGHRGWLYYLAVDPTRQGAGLGTALVRAAESRLLALGCPKVNLQVRDDNAGAIAFYRKLGYAVDATASLGMRLIADGPGPDGNASARNSATYAATASHAVPAPGPVDRSTSSLDTRLLALARDALSSAYARYSEFPVGAAVLADDGRIYTGANVENASYGLTMCAERVAIFSAVAAGARRISAIGVVASKRAPITPCGACRQVIAEFATDACVVYAEGESGPIAWTARELLPQAFGPSDVASGST